ncbi:MAG: glycosylhydrolase-like jelly roll fold domain-containing protein, partial [Candidatus Cyclobacteriaceae bacterium M3_2C_046]
IHDHNLKDARIFLDLGDLSHVAEVWLNEEPLGIAWAKPYRFDITDVFKPGQNTLVVEVANTWSNRMVGDAITGQNFTSTNKTTTVVPGLNALWIPWKEVPLIRSGLFGPVEIITVEPIKMQPDNLTNIAR